MAEAVERTGENDAVSFLNKARQLVSTGAYAKGYDIYIKAFEKFPDLKPSTEAEFRELLAKLNDVLVKINKVGDIFYNFERAITAYPGNIYILNDIGKYLYKFGYYPEACCHFQKALNSDSGFVDAEKNLNSVKNFLIERWHYRMLNDKVRNETYRKAINKMVTPIKDSVLDLGTGTGLLTLYASERRPMAMTAVDGSDIMADIAQSVMLENHISLVVVVSKMSTDLNYLDIGGKRSVILVELFDAGLFGEHVLQTLIHAWEHLTSNVGRVMPNRAEYFIAGVKSDFLNQKYQLSTPAKALLDISNLRVHVATSDSYDCDDIHMIKDVTYMTEPQSLLKIDFNSITDIKSKLYKKDPYEVSMRVKESGDINAIVGWFDLHLTEGVMLTTNPMDENRANAWQQAIFFDFVPTIVRKDESIPIQFTSFDGKLALIPDVATSIIRISPEMLRFLNDADYMNVTKECIASASIYLQQLAEMSEITIVDLCPFPVFGLLLMKRGAQSLLCYAKNREDKKFIKTVFKANKVSMSKVQILIGHELVEEAFARQKYHVIYNNIIEWCGDISPEFKTLGDYLNENHLTPGGLFLPYQIELHCQLISCNWLDVINRVYDENVHDYKIAMFMNKYQVSQNIHVDLVNLDFKPISEPTRLGPIGLGVSAVRSEVINVPVINDGDANAVICWYTIKLMEGGTVIDTKRGNSFVDGMAFLANPAVAMKCGGIGNILKCVAPDGAFKLVIDAEQKQQQVIPP